eukprot:8394172-Pyramimonas_sp.AAC.1
MGSLCTRCELHGWNSHGCANSTGGTRTAVRLPRVELKPASIEASVASRALAWWRHLDVFHQHVSYQHDGRRRI